MTLIMGNLPSKEVAMIKDNVYTWECSIEHARAFPNLYRYSGHLRLNGQLTHVFDYIGPEVE